MSEISGKDLYNVFPKSTISVNLSKDLKGGRFGKGCPLCDQIIFDNRLSRLLQPELSFAFLDEPEIYEQPRLLSD